MTKAKQRGLAVAAMLALVIAVYFAWQALGKQQTIHAELRTARMEQAEAAAPDGVLQAQELLAGPVEQDGVTLHRAAYYPQAQALVCFFEDEDPNRDIYLAALPDVNATILPEEHSIAAVIFEDVPPEALSGGIVVDLTDWQFESSHPVTFALDG